jgi:arylsulfatase A-like enzyme
MAIQVLTHGNTWRVLILTFLIVINFNISICSQVLQKHNQRPNIILLVADDLRYDAFGFTGNKIAKTKAIDSLANESFCFRQSYVTSSICVISRASIFSGQYVRRHQVDNFDKSLIASTWQSSYPILLRKSGYYTGFIGKYGLGGSLPSADFDYWKGFSGHGSYFITDSTGEKIHETSWMIQKLKEGIRSRDHRKPFCFSVSFKAPHSQDGIKENNGFLPNPEYKKIYADQTFIPPGTINDSDYLKFPKQWRINTFGKENEARIRFHQRFSDSIKYQTTTRAIYQLIYGIDQAVKELRLFLKENELEHNTIILLTSDNGYYMGEHGLEGKWYGHNESIRVPLIIFDPRVRKKVNIDHFALNVDIAPTILKLANISAPSEMQGIALLEAENETKKRKFFYYEHPFDPGSYPVYIPTSKGIVTKKWKYMIYYSSVQDSIPIFEELFKRKKDPQETYNLFQSNQNRSYRRVRRNLNKKIQNLETILR